MTSVMTSINGRMDASCNKILLSFHSSVIIDQEIGTTLTAQIVAFNIGNFNMIFVVLGVIFFEFFQNRDWKKYGEVSFGIGIVFLGMTPMSGALKDLVEVSWVGNSLVAMGQYPLARVLAGLIMTSIVQSSTAVTSVTVAMGISQVINLDGAIGIILGANISSCVTGFIASLPLSRAARHIERLEAGICNPQMSSLQRSYAIWSASVTMRII